MTFLETMALAGLYLSLTHSLDRPRPMEPQYCVMVEQNVDTDTMDRYNRTAKIDGYIDHYVTVGKGKKKHRVPIYGQEDYAWKDPDAAEKAGQDLQTYLLALMRDDVKVRIYWLNRTVDALYVSVGPKSICRDDYRQGLITHGVRAHVGLSRHGGSLQGGKCWAVDLAVQGSRASQVALNDGLIKLLDKIVPRFGLVRPLPKTDPLHIQLAHIPDPVQAVAGVKGKTKLAKKSGKKIQLAKNKKHKHGKKIRLAHG